MPTFDNVLVTGNQTIDQDLQVNGNETINTHLNVNGSITVGQHIQVNGSQNISTHLNVAGEIVAGGSLSSQFRTIINDQPTLPATLVTTSPVRYYDPGTVNQPGLLLKGTDGLNYVLFVDASGETPVLALQKA